MFSLEKGANMMMYNGEYKETLDKGRNYTDIVGTGLSIASIVFGTLVLTNGECEGMPMVPICMIGKCLTSTMRTFLSNGKLAQTLFMDDHHQFSKSSF